MAKGVRVRSGPLFRFKKARRFSDESKNPFEGERRRTVSKDSAKKTYSYVYRSTALTWDVSAPEEKKAASK